MGPTTILTTMESPHFILKRALAVLLSLLLWFLYLKVESSYPLEFYFGDFWQRRMAIPYTVPLAVFGIAFFLARKRARAMEWIEPFLATFITHLYFLLLEFIRRGDGKGLPSEAFQLYCVVASVGLVCVIPSLGLKEFYEKGKKPSHPFILFLGSLIFVLPLALDPWLAIGCMAFGHVLYFLSKSQRWLLGVKKLAQPRWMLALILFGALLLRLVASYRLSSMGVRVLMVNSDDAENYHTLALALMSGMPTQPYYSLGYSFWLALYYKVMGFSYFPILVGHSLMGTATVGATYWMGCQLRDKTTGLIAAFLSGFSLLMIFNSVNLTRENLGSFLVFCFLYGFFRLLHSTRRCWFFLGSLLLGAIAGWLVTVELVFLPIMGLFCGVLFFLDRTDKTRGLKSSVLFLVALVFVVTSMTTFATKKLGFMPRHKDAGELISGTYSPQAKLLWAKKIHPYYFPKETLRGLWQSPIEMGGLLLSKWWLDFRRFYFESNSGVFDPLVLVRNSPLAANMYFYGYLCAFLGFFMMLWRLRSPWHSQKEWLKWVFLGILLLHVMTYVGLFFGYTRFRATMQPLYLLFIGYFISWGLEKIKATRNWTGEV